LKALERFQLKERLLASPGVKLVEPMPYIRFMNLAKSAKCVITDSGGLQEETTYLNIPCLTLRENTERPITVSQGTNKLVSVDSLAENLEQVLQGNWADGVCPPLWDGKTAQRAVVHLRRRTG
jgi:UDP-N-acetylglucosamine 2-epimerase (non-hydrolysing)